MEHYLSERVKNLATSQTLAMAAKARELRGQGKDVIGLSLGEPDFNIPDFIKEAAKKAIDENYNSYTPVDGYLDLKKAIIKKFERDNGLIYNVEIWDRNYTGSSTKITLGSGGPKMIWESESEDRFTEILSSTY